MPGADAQPATFANGTTGTLTVSVPAGTPSGARGVVFLASQPARTSGAAAYGPRMLWPLFVDVQ